MNKFIIFAFFAFVLVSAVSAASCQGNCHLNYNNCYEAYVKNPSNNFYACLNALHRCVFNCQVNNPGQ
ncbi:hypothetical protein PPL_11008 [Heterostelium album PN500]|uniref:Uncharacterized protein n=1 Tax=Heterostelium pallidum (strain ATCC 26659 / Pp 5 / PN500) TaxID=670386 RepID=D3BSN9_HETP5|nr:hypothetical protein PPL_11008 [Heterostelium album PN500]EFA75504.1 hypothetical protein PPL_11008 [Heterostelium album PN500]|eukprot:XP_020427638.1 hypothetical protein PPL_11008 [Heterostelium album PN500]